MTKNSGLYIHITAQGMLPYTCNLKDDYLWRLCSCTHIFHCRWKRPWSMLRLRQGVWELLTLVTLGWQTALMTIKEIQEVCLLNIIVRTYGISIRLKHFFHERSVMDRNSVGSDNEWTWETGSGCRFWRQTALNKQYKIWFSSHDLLHGQRLKWAFLIEICLLSTVFILVFIVVNFTFQFLLDIYWAN